MELWQLTKATEAKADEKGRTKRTGATMEMQQLASVSKTQT